mmetsp:Transcript_75486/g.233042  ORF Transcript_75486/g.233042 Transcript_75486/m.233042 type:complete len:214 (-) Transcript_75486:199-840(-)
MTASNQRSLPPNLASTSAPTSNLEGSAFAASWAQARTSSMGTLDSGTLSSYVHFTFTEDLPTSTTLASNHRSRPSYLASTRPPTFSTGPLLASLPKTAMTPNSSLCFNRRSPAFPETEPLASSLGTSTMESGGAQPPLALGGRASITCPARRAHMARMQNSTQAMPPGAPSCRCTASLEPSSEALTSASAMAPSFRKRLPESSVSQFTASRPA